MEPVFLVFVIASFATYLPIYWTLTTAMRLYAQRQAHAPSARSAARDEFLQCLKTEAGKRGVETLSAALQEVRAVARDRSAHATPLSDEWLAILAEARRTLAPLFQKSELAEYDRLTQLLVAGDTRRLAEIEDGIDAIKPLLLKRNGLDRKVRSRTMPNGPSRLLFSRAASAKRESFA